MERKYKIITAILITTIIIVIIIIILNLSQKNLSPAELETCNALTNNPNAINMVFFSTKEQAQEYSNYFINSEPYKNYKNSFNFYYIDSYKPECELYQGIAILCYSRELIKKASSCPNDFIVIIKDQPSNIRSTAYMNVMSLNAKHNKNVLLHELGHALANLADEYIPATIPRKSKNCAENCDHFQNLGECKEGCSDSSHYRSINNGVMKTLNTNKYGEFNLELILQKIPSATSKLTSFSISEETNCENSEYILITGNYNQGEILIKEKTIETGCLGTNGIGDYEYNLILEDNLNLQEEFNPQFIFTDVQEENQIQGGAVEQEGEFYLKIPKIENSKILEISKENKKLTEINLQDIDSRPCKI